MKHFIRSLCCCSPVFFLLAGCDQRNIPAEPTLNMREVSALRKAILSEAAGGGAEAEVVERTAASWGTIEGKFVLRGAPPNLSPLVADKDTAVCAPGGKQPPNESLVIGPGAGIGNIFIYCTDKIPLEYGLWVHDSYDLEKNPDLQEVEFDQKVCIFLSHGLTMRADQRMKILNSDPIGHNTNLSPNGRTRPFNQTIPANGYSMYEPGGESNSPFPVTCSIHPWMQAFLNVRDNPYFAVTQKDGSFTIPNLPAGVELEFRVWQERSKYLEGVTVNGTAEKWSKGKFTVKLADNETKTFNIEVDAAAFQ